MKNHILFIAAALLTHTAMNAQVLGNATTTYSNISGDATLMNCSAANILTTSSGSAANYTWSGNVAQGGSQNINLQQGANAQYYNPYTGRYENTPTGGNPTGNEKAQAPLPFDNTVIFDADVMINMQATSYTAIFSVTDFGKTVAGADSALNSRIDKFTASMKKDGIKEGEIHIDFISMLPIYEVLAENKVFSNVATEKPAGFKIKKNIHVLFYKHTQLDRIISEAAQSEIYDLVKVDYNLNNIEAAYDTLRKVAASIIAMKRATYALMGMQTKMTTMAEGYDSKYPSERYEAYTAYLQGMSGQNLQQKNPNLEVRAAEKEQTVFYNKVPYKQFDRVLNADLAEPGVQFYYKLRIKCVVMVAPEETKPAPNKPGSTVKVPATTGPQPAIKNY